MPRNLSDVENIETKITLNDVVTLNVSTTKHGFAPKAPNDATKYLDGTGAYSVPAGGTPGGANTQVQFNDGGAFGGDSQLTFDKTSGLLTITANAHAGAALARFNPDSGASFVQINNNGTVIIDSDVATGNSPLIIRYNGSAIWTFAFNNEITGGSSSAIYNNNYKFVTSAGDTNISRISAGLIGIGTGAVGSFAGSIKCTDIFTNNADALIKTNTTLNNGAAAGAGTLTNAPSAGDPTKWIKIVDNGTTRFIPTWT